MEGFSTPEKRSGRLVLEANPNYWDRRRLPRVKRIVFDNEMSQKGAIEAIKTGEGRADLVTELSPLETLRVAQSPFATVVKSRRSILALFGQFNMRKPGSPWIDVRVRRAANLAINRPDLIRYAANGNGVGVPALLGVHAFGHDPALAPYPFDPAKARELLREAGHADGLAVSLIATEDLETQTTVVGKMLEQAGFRVERQILDPAAFGRRTFLRFLDQPAERQTWDIALTSWGDVVNFPPYQVYHVFALGASDWTAGSPELRRLYDEVLRAVDREKQQDLIRQMERYSHDQAYFLFLYNPIQLYAVNKAVQFVPYLTGLLSFAETSLTDRHWSVRKGAEKQ